MAVDCRQQKLSQDSTLRAGGEGDVALALISEFIELASGEGKRHPTTVQCGWRILSTDSGPLLVLESYGSSTRKLPGKTSQSLQLDRQGASELKKVLERAFPGI